MMTTPPMTPQLPAQSMAGPGLGGVSPDMLGLIRQLSESGATRLPPVASGPVGTTDYATSMGFDPEDSGEDLYLPDPIDHNGIHGLTPERMTELAELLWNFAWESKQARKDGGRDEATERFRDLYEGILEEDREKPWENSSEVSTPDTKVQVKTVAARIKSSIFSSPRWCTVKPGFPEDGPAALKCQNFLKSEMGGASINLPVKFYKASQDALVDGQKVGMSVWVRKRAKTRRRVLLNDAALKRAGIAPPLLRVPGAPVHVGKKTFGYGQWAILEDAEVIENHFDVRFMNASDCAMWPVSGTDEQNATMFGYFFSLTPNELRDMADQGYYDKRAVEDVIEHEPPAAIGDVQLEEDREEQASRDSVSRGSQSEGWEHSPRQLFYCHARVHDGDHDGMNEDICFCFAWNTKTFVRIALPDVSNGVRPFRKLEFYPRVGGGYHGYSLVEELFDTQMELNAITRQGIDGTALAMSCLVEEEQGRRHLSDTPFAPGVRFRDAARDGGVKQIHTFPQVPNSNMVDRAAVRQMIEKIGGMDQVLQGSADQSADTLGQTNLAVAGGNIRLNAAIECGMEFLTWLYKQFYDYCQQYMEERKTYEIIRQGNRSFPSITPDDLVVVNYAEVQAYTSTLDPEAALRAQKVQILFQALANSPFMQGNFSRQGKLLTWYARSLGIDDDLTEFIGDEQEWAQMDQEYLMAQQQMQMQGPPGSPPGSLPGETGGGPPPPGAGQGPPPSRSQQAMAIAGR